MSCDDIGYVYFLSNRMSLKLFEISVDLRTISREEYPNLGVKLYFGFGDPSSSPTISRENTRICCEAKIDKRRVMHTQRSQLLLKAREWIVLAISPYLECDSFRGTRTHLPFCFPFARDSLESRQPFKLDHYLMNSQHTTIAAFARQSLIIRPKDITPHRIKILTS